MYKICITHKCTQKRELEMCPLAYSTSLKKLSARTENYCIKHSTSTDMFHSQLKTNTAGGHCAHPDRQLRL